MNGYDLQDVWQKFYEPLLLEMVAHAWNSSIQKTDAGGLAKVQGQFELHVKNQASQSQNPFSTQD